MRSCKLLTVCFSLCVWLLIFGPLPAQCTGNKCSLPPCEIFEAPGEPTPAERSATVAELDLQLSPLAAGDRDIDVTSVPITEASDDVDRLARVTLATCRCTVSGGCGSGTIVGRDADGNSLILTNAHVAGTQRGRRVNVQRWELDGRSERGTATIIASGYSRGLSVDFALLRASNGFGAAVIPIPLADRFPDGKHATNYGCPRCEWPSLQTVQFTDRESQVLRWRPEAIGGRSGSAIVDYSGVNGSPVVVALLTWGGGGEGLGQSSPFVIDALRGRVPRSFELLPVGVTEVACQAPAEPTEDLVDLVTEDQGSADSSQNDLDSCDGDGCNDAGIFRSRPQDDGGDQVKQPRRPRIQRRPRRLFWFGLGVVAGGLLTIFVIRR